MAKRKNTSQIWPRGFLAVLLSLTLAGLALERLTNLGLLKMALATDFPPPPGGEEPPPPPPGGGGDVPPGEEEEEDKIIWSTPTAIAASITAPVKDAVIAPGGTGTVTVTASDKDTRQVGTDLTEHADTVNRFEWTSTAADGTPAGTFTDTTQATTTWTAPQTPGTYTLTCKVDDAPDAIPPGEDGPGSTRDDAAVEVKVTVHVAIVKFVEDPQQQYGLEHKYGFDDFTNRDTTKVPWKSVEVGQSDTAIAEITPPSAARGVYFRIGRWPPMQVLPWQASQPQQVVTVSPYVAGENNVDAYNGAIGLSPSLGTMHVAAYAKVTRRVGIAVVNEENGNINGVDILPRTDIEAYLKKVYDQAVCAWEIVPLPTKTVRFDFNDDNLIDTSGFGNRELAAIRQAYFDELNDYALDKIVFLVAKPRQGYGGLSYFSQPYAYIFADILGSYSPEAIAHELGHSLGLRHTPELDANHQPFQAGTMNDPDNIMYPFMGNHYRIRKGTRWGWPYTQWDMLNPPTP